MSAANDHARRIIRSGGAIEPLDKPTTMREIARLLGAAHVDTVQLRHLGRPVMVMLVDDNGHDKGLPINAEATALYRANCVPGAQHVIRGDVAVVPDRDFA